MATEVSSRQQEAVKIPIFYGQYQAYSHVPQEPASTKTKQYLFSWLAQQVDTNLPYPMSQIVSYVNEDIQKMLHHHSKELVNMLVPAVNSDSQSANSVVYWTSVGDAEDFAAVRIWVKSPEPTAKYETFIFKVFPSMTVAIQKAKITLDHRYLIDQPAGKAFVRPTSDYFGKVVAGFTIDCTRHDIIKYYAQLEEDSGVSCGNLKHYMSWIYGPSFNLETPAHSVREFGAFCERFKGGNIHNMIHEDDVCATIDLKNGFFKFRIVDENPHHPKSEVPWFTIEQKLKYKEEREFIVQQLKARYYFALMCGFSKMALIFHEMMKVVNLPNSDYHSYLWNSHWTTFAKRLISNLKIMLKEKGQDGGIFVQYGAPIMGSDEDGKFEIVGVDDEDPAEDRLYVTRTVWEFMMAEGHPLPVLAPSLERADQEREAKNSQEKRNETQ